MRCFPSTLWDAFEAVHSSWYASVRLISVVLALDLEAVVCSRRSGSSPTSGAKRNSDASLDRSYCLC